MTTPKYSGLEGLAGLARDEGFDARPTLLRVLIDLYLQQPVHTPEEEKQFTELTLRLIDEVDVASRLDTARRLAGYAGTPAAVARRLAGDVPEVAEAIARRAAAPAQRSEQPARGRTDDAVTGLGERFFSADAAARAAMLNDLASNTDAEAAAPRGAADAVTRLEAAALQGRPYEFVRELERSLAIPRRQAERIVNDASGEPLLVVARALAMPSDVLQRILLLVNPAIGTSVRRVFDLSALYETLSAPAAAHLVSLWRRPAAPRRDAEATTQRPNEADARRAPSAARNEIGTAAAAPRRDQRAS